MSPSAGSPFRIRRTRPQVKQVEQRPWSVDVAGNSMLWGWGENPFRRFRSPTRNIPYSNFKYKAQQQQESIPPRVRAASAQHAHQPATKPRAMHAIAQARLARI